ncbi:AraC family transcriptional regulator [Thermobacillus sp. ZCTH02-B1]|uniref:helix-turn-helix transcriptional regulator n=1 Tax=Thermobacillus sp. ZCTH02-B1 TaxID=1858795 RepID=UPI0025FC7A88|nr:AraC family transcriptional regulator [Thermobacillus sp. ZCTH02-B1]
MYVESHSITNRAIERERIYIRHRVTEWQDNWPFHTHDGFEIYFFHEGQAHFIINREIYVLSPGDMLLFRGDVLHRPNPSRDVPYIRSYMNFSADYVREMVGADWHRQLMRLFANPNGLLVHWDEEEAAEIERVFREMLREQQEKAAGYEWMLQSMAAQLLIRILRKTERSGSLPAAVAPTRKERIVREILAYLDEHYRSPVSLDMLEAHAHLNKYYICHCFKEVTGMSIRQYILRRRINEAKKLLWLTDEPVEALSERLGFGYPMHFSRMFKLMTGVSPRQYRQQARAAGKVPDSGREVSR